jgi:hypothetical protein
VREGQRLAVRNGQECRLGTQRSKSLACGAAEHEAWRAVAADDLDATPSHPERVAGAERLHCCFLGREPGREALRRPPASAAVRDFICREDTPQKPLAVPINQSLDTVDFDRIKPQANDAHGQVLYDGPTPLPVQAASGET